MVNTDNNKDNEQVKHIVFNALKQMNITEDEAENIFKEVKNIYVKLEENKEKQIGDTI